MGFKKFKIRFDGTTVIFSFCLVVAVGLTLFLQNYTKTLLRSRLNERLIAIVSTGALQFDGDDIRSLAKIGLKAAETENYKKSVLKLQAIRSANKNIRYAYIITQTQNPMVVKYVVDADAMILTPVVDFNEDGLVDQDDVSKPGDEYDASDVPAMQGPAFQNPTVDEDLSIDTWGIFLSAYAPIYSQEGSVVGALTIDVEVSDFTNLVNATFVPFLMFIVILLVIISFLTIFVVKIWRSRVQVLQDLDRQKDELLSIVAHQLAKPITAIRWDLESLMDGDLGKLSGKQSEEVGLMKSQAVNLADLVSMILDVSRIQLGKIHLDPQPLDLQSLFKEMLDVIKPQITEKKIAFIKHMPKTLPTVRLDRRYTRMTIENMLTNAVKYTPEKGNVTLDVTIEKGVLRVSVADTGCGIPKVEQEKIFGKMYRASNVRNTVEGNGFGLYVAKGAIEAQGGTMGFTSEEGKGTTFFVELPVREA